MGPSVFIDDPLRNLCGSNIHPPAMLKKQVSGLLFAADVAACTVTSAGLQEGINRVQESCKERRLMINIEKTKIAVFKNGGRLSKNEKWRLGTEE
jgi:hypothetical protein